MIPKLVIESGASWTEAGVALLSDALPKGSALLLCCALATWLMRRSSAASRHLVWTFGVIGALLIPPLTYVLPAWRIAPPLPALLPDPGFELVIRADATKEAASTGSPTAGWERTVEPIGFQAPSDEPIAFDVSTVPPAIDWRRLALATWLGGIAVSLASLLFSLHRVRRLQSGTLLVSTGPCVAAVARVSARIGLTRPPRVHVGDERLMPMVWGLLRPVLLLPAGAARWSSAKLEAVLLHELAHVRRRDALTQFIAELARAVYWFNPLVWLAARRLYLEREHACDDIVLNAGTRASDYAGELLELVRSLRTTRATAMAAIAMARPSQVKVRLSAVLDDARNRTSVDRRLLAGVSLAALLLILPLAAMRPLATSDDIPILQLEPARVHPRIQPTPPSAPATARQSDRSPELAAVKEDFAASISFVPALPAPPAREATAVLSASAAAATAQETCWNSDRRNTSISSNTDEDLTTLKWSSGRCSGSVRMEGRVRLNGDFSGVSSIAPGGMFRIEEDNGDTERRLVIRPTNGQLTYEYRVDGRDRQFDGAGRAWLSAALATLFRTTGFAADERADYLLRTQGPSGVLAEVGQMRSDYVQRIYLQKLLERADLSPALVRQAVELSAREIQSDYELAQLLIAFSKRYDLNQETRAILIGATNTIQSDYEQRRVLAAALAKGELRSQDVAAMLDAAQNISSDYERAQLLLGLVQKYKLDPSMRAAYLTAAQGIRSDYEQRRVYDHLIKQGELSSNDIAHVLQYASAMSSDYEKAQLLTSLNRFDLSDAQLQRAFLEATARIRSDYEHRRVLTALLDKEKLTPGNLDLALQSAATIESDYELAQVLLLIVKNHSLNERQKAAFLKALNSISSTHEYGRVASALLKSSN